MGAQTTASKTALLLQCSRPFADNTEIGERNVGEPARYGSCLHELQDLALKGEGTPDLPTVCAKWGAEDVDGVRAHIAEILACLRTWCEATGNPFGIRWTVKYSEFTMATKIEGAKKPVTRAAFLELEEHRYDLRPGEMGGAFDVLLEGENGELCVLDLKTGNHGNMSSPASLPQLKTLVLQCSARWKASKWYAAILHSPRGTIPVLYAEEVSREDMQDHLSALRAAYARIGDGSLRPGSQCSKCPALDGCPANDGRLLGRSEALVKAAGGILAKGGEVDPGKLHMFLTEFDKLAKRAREVLKDAVRAGGHITRPDGKVLTLRHGQRENLSKAGVVAALGKDKGAEKLEELRALGCLTTSETESLVAVEDEGPRVEVLPALPPHEVT